MKKLVFLLLLVACIGQAPVQPVVERPVVEAPVLVQPTAIPLPPVVETCVDSDGSDAFVKGKVVKGAKILEDSCLSLKSDSGPIPISKVIEYACDNNEIVATPVDCSLGCLRGACLGDVEKQFLVKDGECNSVGGFLITNCLDGCLDKTMCVPAPAKTKSITLPFQLSCLVPTEEWVINKWFDFEVPRAMEVLIFVDISGSEFALVEVRDSEGKLVVSPLNKKRISNNRCFTDASGFARASLQKGKYEVRVGAKGEGSEKFRSLKAKNFAVAVIS